MAVGVRPEIEAAWLHHRFTQIHPFQDGNGRAGACTRYDGLSSMAGSVPLVIRDDVHREAYLDALGEADDGDLEPLVDLFANVVSADLNDAITFVRSAHGRDIGAIAAAAADAAQRHVVHDARGSRQSRTTTVELAGLACATWPASLPGRSPRCLPGLARQSSMPGSSRTILEIRDVHGRPCDNGGSRSFVRQMSISYAPDLSQYKRWIGTQASRCYVRRAALAYRRLVYIIKESRAGVMTAVVFLTTSDEADAGRQPASDVARPTILGAKREFTHSGHHPQDDRFLAWLDAALTTALEEWQARL